MGRYAEAHKQQMWGKGFLRFFRVVGVGLWRLTVGGGGIDDYHEAGLWKVEVGYLLLEVIGVRLVGVVFGD
jgi:hypothetical protein